jgi:hypothetical protein
MDQDTKTAAHELLAAHRQAMRDHDAAGDRLRRARLAVITSARTHGMTWDSIARHLGSSDGGNALRMWYIRNGGFGA